MRLGKRVGTLRSAGALDGIWTAATSVGSKAEVLALLTAAAYAGGTVGVAGAVLSLAIGGLALSFIDAGLTAQSARVFAAAPDSDRRIVRRPLALRAMLYVVVVPDVAWLLFGTAVSNPLAWAFGTALYALGLQLSQVTTGARYGTGAFRGGAVLNGGIRLLAVPLLLLLGASGLEPALLVFLMAVTELAIAAVQYANLPRRADSNRRADPQLRVASTWKFGVAAALNGLVNRSDTVLIAGVVTASALATYGVASQLENALTTVALVPSGAVLVYAARAKGKGDGAGLQGVLVIATAVAAVYLVIGLAAIVWVEPITVILFDSSVADTTPLVICVVAGLFGALGGVASQHLVGIGASSRTLAIWIVVAVVAVVALPVGAALGGASGAAVGALVRDLVFCGLGWGSVVQLRNRRRIDA